ncbi:hypothetical protein R3Q06_35810 [Rhodococcus erythropolis]|uniref:hypothetical protein n=1 Tax=Rhodococcus erythropolis TaxID=1833 RepID=UPI00294A9522|nr:hypothetical protein [Rhodococcus erythropolis]MDV6278737.1 hypothetical protein [Rhodococcus erythropolis]
MAVRRKQHDPGPEHRMLWGGTRLGEYMQTVAVFGRHDQGNGGTHKRHRSPVKSACTSCRFPVIDRSSGLGHRSDLGRRHIRIVGFAAGVEHGESFDLRCDSSDRLRRRHEREVKARMEVAGGVDHCLPLPASMFRSVNQQEGASWNSRQEEEEGDQAISTCHLRPAQTDPSLRVPPEKPFVDEVLRKVGVVDGVKSTFELVKQNCVPHFT